MKKLLLTFILGLLVLPTLALSAPVSWDFTSGVLQPLQSGWSAVVRGSVFQATSTTATSTFPNASTTRLCIGSDCRTAWPAGSIGTSSVPTAGQLAFWTGASTLSSVATGTLTESITGIQISAARGLVGGAADISLSPGYEMMLTASGTNFNTFYNTPSSRITAGTGLSWSGNTLNSTGGGSFTVGATTTPMWRSTLQAWTFPDGLNVNTDIQNNRFHTIKPIWYQVNATGSVTLRTVAGFGAFGYNASNTQIIKENSVEQFVTVSGNDPEIHVLTGSTTLATNAINTFIGFATSTGFTGIELDWEGFADWGAASTTNYINFVRQLSNEAHKYGLKTMIYLPPIWNSASNAESGSGDEWDSANSDGYYELEYQDFEDVPVDYLLIAVYDYHFDYSAGRPNAPLKWQDEIIAYAKRKISDHDRLIIGIPAAGYRGATGGYSFLAQTYAAAMASPGSSTATRDAESGELTWTNGGNSYFTCDNTCINIKRERAEREGISRVSLWHIGDNQYGSGKIEPTLHASPYSNQTDVQINGENNGSILRLFSNTGTKFFDLLNTGIATISGNWTFTGTTTLATTTSSNLTATLLNGLAPASYLARANHTGTQLAATISDFVATVRTSISETTTGLDYNSGTGVLSVTSGHIIPTTASTTNYDTFYGAPSSRITAGTNLSWSGNTLNAPTMTATVGGAVPTPPNNTTTFLRGDGTFAAPSSGFADPLTTNGDIIARISGATTRLAQGGNGTFLGVSGGVLGYYTPAGGSSNWTDSGLTLTPLTSTDGIVVNGTSTFATTTMSQLTINQSLLPDTNDGAVIGSTSLQFSDMFLAEGGVINWDNGDATLTQTNNLVQLSGAQLRVGSGSYSEFGASTMILDDGSNSVSHGVNSINWDGDVLFTKTSNLLSLTGGDLALGAGLRDVTNSLGTSGMVLQTTGTSTRWVATSTLGLGGGGGGSGTVNSGTQGQVAYYASNGTAVSGTSTLFIASDGKVGIGTTTPADKLTVQVANNQGIEVISSNSAFIGYGKIGADRFRMQNEFTNVGLFEILYNNGAGGPAGTSLLTLTGVGSGIAGRMGLNNTAPDATLDVQALAGVNPFRVASSSGAALFTVLASGAFEMATTTSEPSAPILGKLVQFVKNIAGKSFFMSKNPAGNAMPQQDAMWNSTIVQWRPTTATGGLWVQTVGAGAGTFANTLPSNSTLLTQQKRARYSNVVTTLNQVLGQRNTEALFWRGDSANEGGFFICSDFGYNTWTNGSRHFNGLHSGTGVVTADPSALNNTVGFAVDAADNGLIHFLTRGTSATKASTGLTITSGKGYKACFYAAPNSSQIGWWIKDINTGTEVSGVATANLPSATTFLTLGVLASNAALTTVNATQLEVANIYAQIDY